MALNLVIITSIPSFYIDQFEGLSQNGPHDTNMHHIFAGSTHMFYSFDIGLIITIADNHKDSAGPFKPNTEIYFATRPVEKVGM